MTFNQSFIRTSQERFLEHRTDSYVRWLVPADGSGPEGGSAIARRGRVRMPLSSEPQSIRSRSEESEEGGATQREGGREFKKSVADQDDKNRIAPSGFDVNGRDLELDAARRTCPDRPP